MESYDGQYGVIEWTLRNEIRAEVNLEVGVLDYLTSVAFRRSDGIPTVKLAFSTRYTSGEIRLSSAHTEYRWIRPEQAADFDLIEGLENEIQKYDRRLREKR